MLPAMDEKAAVKRWLRGQRAAEERQRRLLVEEGPDPDRAVAESLAMLDVLMEMGMWPGPRDPVSERYVEVVRRRWARIQRRARAGDS